MKRNENPQGNERITKKGRKKEKKREQHLELVPVTVIGSKSVLKVNAAQKAENGDLSSKSKTISVFYFRHPNRTP